MVSIQIRHSFNIFLWAVWIVFAVSDVVVAETPPSGVLVPSYATLLTDDLDKKPVIKSFSCEKRVYLFLTWFRLEGLHEVTAFWINPKGKQENQIKLKFLAKKPKVQNWVALEFKNIFDKKNPLVPNLKVARLAGIWKVKLLLDGNLLETLDFFVSCG